MNSLKNPDIAPDIVDVRAQIDAIDANIAKLIAQRCALSAAVGAAKRGAGDHAFGWRPARETEIVRTILKNETSLDPALVSCVWRALISANLAAQGNLVIVAAPESLSAARASFSVGVDVHTVSNHDEVLAMVASNDHAIGFLLWPTSDVRWWVDLATKSFEGVHVCAAAPNSHGNATPSTLLVAQRRPEPTGFDVSLLAGPQSIPNSAIAAQCAGLVLCEVKGFLTEIPDGFVLIGAYAHT